MFHGDAAWARGSAFKREQRRRRADLVAVPIAQDQFQHTGLAGSPPRQAGAVERRRGDHRFGGVDEHGDVPSLRAGLEQNDAFSGDVRDSRDFVHAVAQVENLALVRGSLCHRVFLAARGVNRGGEVRAAVVYTSPAALARDELERETFTRDGFCVRAGVVP